jgi:DNA replication and repair protein RecF
MTLACELPAGVSQNSTASHILHLTSLSLHFFRNYTSARLEVSRAPVVLTGRNGAGKTNILEAISLLTPGRGIRRAKIGDIDRVGGELPWAVAANIYGMQGEAKIGTGRDAEGDEGTEKRIIKVDGKVSRGQAELARHLAMVWLTPQMEQLFQEGASAGRKFLDRLVYSFDSEHASRINEYDYAMRERNKLLSGYRPDANWLDALEQTMAETAAAIAQARLSTVEHINISIQESTLSFPKAHMAILGVVEDMLTSGMPAVMAEEAFKKRLREGRGQDAAAGRTLAGIHRSEMQVIHIIKQMPAGSCSTGEQKALLLSIVLAQARAGARWSKVVPIILLDEVVAHLDSTRRLELFEEICQIGAQTWMTGTDAALFAGLEHIAQYFQVDSGTITHG